MKISTIIGIVGAAASLIACKFLSDKENMKYKKLSDAADSIYDWICLNKDGVFKVIKTLSLEDDMVKASCLVQTVDEEGDSVKYKLYSHPSEYSIKLGDCPNFVQDMFKKASYIDKNLKIIQFQPNK